MTKFSGATQQSLAQLLESEATHSIIDSLFLRYEVKQLPPGSSTNKLRKANELVRRLNERGVLSDLIQYLATPASGLSSAFRRGAPKSQDLYAQVEKDTAGSPSEEGKPRTKPAEPAPRQFARPGTTAPATTSPQPAANSKRYVFVVRGRDHAAYQALVALLTALDLRVVTWDEATRQAGGGTPHTLDIVRAGIEMSDAVLVLMTPDDVGHVKSDFYYAGRDDPREASDSGQARQNVIFEAGWAMALSQDTVILVRVGDVRPLSDIDGLNYVWLTNDVESRRQLITRLRNCKLSVHDDHDRWRTAGEFPER